MNNIKNVAIFGDSILKGVQINAETGRYYTDNSIDFAALERDFSLKIENFSSFGCTVAKGYGLIERFFANGNTCDMVIMDYGGNDCDYKWSEVAENPTGEHLPKVPWAEFEETYHRLIELIRANRAQPVLCTLPPLQGQWFFDWFCRDLDKAAILSRIGDVSTIFNHQGDYSRLVEKIAGEAKVPLIDLRSAFMAHDDYSKLLCEDGTHTNTLGQGVISSVLYEYFGRNK